MRESILHGGVDVGPNKKQKPKRRDEHNRKAMVPKKPFWIIKGSNPPAQQSAPRSSNTVRQLYAIRGVRGQRVIFRVTTTKEISAYLFISETISAEKSPAQRAQKNEKEKEGRVEQ